MAYFVKDPLKRLSLYLGIVVAILTIIVLTLTIPKLWKNNVEPATAQFYGVVRDEKGQPVAGAEIRIVSPEDTTQLLGKGPTQPNGQFNIVVKAKPETAVWVTIAKDSVVGFAEMQVLAGNKSLTFKRKP